MGTFTPLPSPVLPTYGTNPNGVLGYITPARMPGIIAPALAGVTLIGLLGGDKARDDSLAKMGLEYDQSTGLTRKIKTPNTGMKAGAPPFTGGQMQGITYKVTYGYVRYDGVTITTEFINAIGAIGYSNGIITYASVNGNTYTPNAGSFNIYSRGVKSGTQPWLISIQRLDGQNDTGGNPPSLQPDSVSGYVGTGGESLQDRFNKKSDSPILLPSLSSSVGWGDGKGLNAGLAGALLGGQLTKDRDPKGFNLGEGFAINLAPTISPLKNPSDDRIKNPNQDPVKTPKKDDPKRSPFIPPAPNDLGNINNQLFQIGSILGVISANTSSESQRANSKNGACDALNSPSCREGLKNDIKNPLEAKLDAAQIARDGNAAAQSAALAGISVEQQAQKGVLAAIASKATNIFDLLGKLFNNTLIDKAMQYITMITVIHNAAMLSRGIADTLGSAIDNAMVSLNFAFKDKDGHLVGINQAIGNTTQSLIRKAIGNDVYEGISNTFTQANRVYQAGINLLSNVQSILDSTTAVAELTSNRVATLMNSLRNAGVVREDAYGSQTPNTTRFNAFMQKLENLEQGTSNLASITGNIVSVQQSVNELKTNRTEFENAIKDKNKTEEDTKTEKREESVYTIGNFTIVRPPEQT